MVYIFDFIYIPAHQAHPETLQHEYCNTVTGLYQIERRMQYVCLNIESSNSLYCLTGI